MFCTFYSWNPRVGLEEPHQIQRRQQLRLPILKKDLENPAILLHEDRVHQPTVVGLAQAIAVAGLTVKAAADGKKRYGLLLHKIFATLTLGRRRWKQHSAAGLTRFRRKGVGKGSGHGCVCEGGMKIFDDQSSYTDMHIALAYMLTPFNTHTHTHTHTYTPTRESS